MTQIEMVSVEGLVSQDHMYRKLMTLLDFSVLLKPLSSLTHNIGSDGFGIERHFKCLFLQFMEDLSDRQLERYF